MIALELFFILLLADICDAAKRGRGCGCKHVLGHTIQHRICKENCRLRRHYLFDWPTPINPTKDPKCEKCENLPGERRRICEVDFCGLKNELLMGT